MPQRSNRPRRDWIRLAPLRPGTTRPAQANPRGFNDLHECWRPRSRALPADPELLMIFETLDTTGHEQVVFCHNKDAGLKAIIAIHNTTLGPALGGTRMWPYKSEAEALNDVLR